MHILGAVNGIPALRRDAVPDRCPGGAVAKEILHLHLCSLDRVGILQGKEFLEITPDTPFGKIPGSAGGCALMWHSLSDCNQVLRKIVGIIRPQPRRKTIRDRLRTRSSRARATLVLYA